MQTVRVSQEGKWRAAIVRYVLSLSADIFLQKIRKIIFDTICYRFHSAYDSQFDGVLFDNQEHAYIKRAHVLKEYLAYRRF